MSATEWVRETIQAGVELAKEHPVAAAAVGVTVVAGVGYGGYRVYKSCKAKRTEKEVVAVAVKDPLLLTKADIDAIADATVAKFRTHA